MRRIAAVVVALCAFSALAQNDPFTLGKAAMERNDAEAAVGFFEKAVAAQPKNALYHFWLGNAYGSQAQKANMFSQARLAGKTKDEFERAVQLDPNLLDARFGLIDFYTMAPAIIGGSEEKAIQQAAEIKKRDSLQGHRAMARIYSRQKKTDLARNEWLAAVKEQPTSAKAHNGLAGFYLGVDKNNAAAMTEAEAAVKADPSYMPAWFRVGQVAANAGTNLLRGEEAMKKYLAYKPQDNEPGLADANYWLGMIYEKMGRKAE
ncbi:MAG TPA: tetratricopeptide repeat protein, partial [Thermoanaerobaculia bacterium]|nr:tetratricopeptide repeat protein [Thermoanaerobaculia bacterium]